MKKDKLLPFKKLILDYKDSFIEAFMKILKNNDNESLDNLTKEARSFWEKFENLQFKLDSSMDDVIAYVLKYDEERISKYLTLALIAKDYIYLRNLEDFNTDIQVREAERTIRNTLPSLI